VVDPGAIVAWVPLEEEEVVVVLAGVVEIRDTGVMAAVAGDSNRSGPGTGGPGKGFGSVDKDADGQTATKATKMRNQDRQGQIVASWYFKGEQIKGESSKELDQMIQTAKDNAAEAISDNEIPRRYEESVKSYFGGLEESVEE